MKPDNSVLEKDTKLKFPHVLVIDASAGSGKTHTLAQRFVQFLLSPKIKHNDLSNIMAITYTNNAAREMKQRIIKWLKVLALDLKGEEQEQIYQLLDLKPEIIRDRAGTAIEEIISRYTDFHVQTIDSFMNRILRSSADELGMPPDNDVTDNYDDLTRQAMDIVFSQFGTSIPFPEIEQFLDLFNQSQTRSFIWNPTEYLIGQFVSFLEQEGKALEEIEFSDQWPVLDKLHSEIWALYKQVMDLGLEDEIRVGITRGLGGGVFKDADLPEYFGSFDPYECGLTKKGIVALLETEKGKELAEKIKTAASGLADAYSRSKYTAFGPLYRHFKIALEEVKHWNETIFFDDINKKLSTYVNQDLVPEIYYRLGDVLYHFLLDEFQDTDRVQWQNVWPLLEEAWSKGGTLFSVGDMKQAIFMWRKADYRIMWNLGRCIRGEKKPNCLPASVQANARIIPLKYNFRSGGKILEFVDSVFKERLKQAGPELLTEDRTGLTDYTQTVPEEKLKSGYVRNIIIPASEETPERDAVLEIIKDVRERYRLADIAILSYKNEQVESVVSWLTEAGIQAASFSSLDIRKRKIIIEIVKLLQFLDTPIDNLSFAAFITGDVFLTAARKINQQISREAVLDMILDKRLHYNGIYLYTYFRDSGLFKELWPIFFEKLYTIVGYYPLYDLVAEAYKIFNVFENFPGETGFLARFLEAITVLESQGMGDIKDFVDMVSNEGGGSLEILLPEYMDAVKAMTFHKAKGLGFPVVINLFYASGDSAENMFFDPQEGRLLIRYLTVAMRKADPHLDEIYGEALLDSRIQDLNLLYVAATRAKNELYNLVIKKIKEEKPAPEKPAPRKAAKGKEKNESKPPGKVKMAPIDLFEELEQGRKERVKVEQKVPKPTPVEIPPQTVYEFTKVDIKGWSSQRLHEIMEGVVYHEIMAGIEYVGDDIEQVVTSLVDKAIRKASVSHEPEKIKTCILKFLALPQVKPWFEKKEGRIVYIEQEFINAEGTLYRMDRVIFDPDQVILIDYKTGGKLELYETQMKNYRQILTALNPGKKIVCFQAYMDSGRIEEAS